MKAVTKILTGAAGLALAAGAFAAPAAAQSYPYGGGLGDVIVGAVINQVIRGAVGGGYNQGYGNQGYGQYGYGYNNQQAQIDQCARAAEQRAGGYNGNYGGYGNQGYGNQGYGGYNNYGSGARVVGITSVERKSSNSLRVRGVLSSGAYAGQYGGQYGGYGSGNAQTQADLRFSCRVDARGSIVDLSIDRNNTSYGYRRY